MSAFDDIFSTSYEDSSSTNAAWDNEICCDLGNFLIKKVLKHGANKYSITPAAIMEIAHKAHWAALIDGATSASGFISWQVDLSEEEVLYGPEMRTFAPQSDVWKPIQPADLLNVTWKLYEIF